MKFNSHMMTQGAHAFLSPSQYHWINYDEDKLLHKFTTAKAAQRGTELHEFASEAIRLGIRLVNNKQTINQYVNDAIGYRMQPEQMLFYSYNCFGTADAISFDEKKMFLRVHDLKTGVTKASENQLYVYVALFCLEYGYKPNDIQAEVRIYQEGEVRSYIPDPVDIMYIMEKIVTFDKKIDELNASL